MNLLLDPWVPVRDNGGFQHATLAAILCQEKDWVISLPRDDMELAALQLAACLAQTILTPETAKDLREWERTPLTAMEYDRAAAKWADLFDLRHPVHPFMQTAKTRAEKKTPVQRLLVGLPDSSAASDESQAFFHGTDEIPNACLPCTALALFQHSTNAVNFGGGFKAGLKDMVPVTTLILRPSLRETIWRNVLSGSFIREEWPELSDDPENNAPTWQLPIRRLGAGLNPPVEAAGDIGLVRGLFWQSAKVRLLISESPAPCGFCGESRGAGCTGLLKEKDPFQFQGFWRHPHTPLEITEKHGATEFHNMKVDSRGRFWTQMLGFFWETRRRPTEPQYRPALVVSQHRQVWPGQRISLAVGGYVNKQARIERRSHEVWTLGEGWEGKLAAMREILESVMGIPDVLGRAVFTFAANFGRGGMSSDLKSGLSARAEDTYLNRTQPEIHGRLREMSDWREARHLRQELAATLVGSAQKTYDEIVGPYVHSPAGLKAVVKGRAVLRGGLAAYKVEHACDTDKAA